MTNTINLLSRAMDAESIRMNVIANNISNADTPYFKRSDVTFEKELFRALKSRVDAETPFSAQMTDERHVPFSRPKDASLVQPKLIVDFQSSYHNDQNNIDPEKEFVYASKTAERYEALSTLVEREFKMLRSVMR